MLQESPSNVEYQIYSIALTSVYEPKNGELIVFNRKTSSTGLAMMTDEDLKENLNIKDPKEIIAWGFPEIANETVEHFIDKNKTGGVLEPKLPLNVAQKCLLEDEQLAIWPDGEIENKCDPINEGWRTFYQRYPTATGIFAFSRVGFNLAQTEALVEISIVSGSLVGQSKIMLLRKSDDGIWLPKRTHLLWVS
jgi:hypothetical protein